jgi:DMSO/TMAO reductase YedYZ molybdopterin-dependent catalytic subunit
MKQGTTRLGGWIGGLLTTPLIGLLYLGQRLWDLPFVPYDVWNWQTGVVPGNILSLFVNGVGFQLSQLLNLPNIGLGKIFEQAVALLLTVGMGAILGAVVAWISRRDRLPAWLTGAGVGLLHFGAVVGIEMSRGLEGNVVLSLLWLAALYTGWGLLTGILVGGKLLAALDAETDPERRRGLVMLATAALGGTLAAWGIGRLAGSETSPGGADEPLGDLLPTLTPTTPVEPGAVDAGNVPIGNDGRIVPAPGTRPEVTPDGEFYRVDISTTPVELDGESWRLNLGGLFQRRSPLTLADLQSYPVHIQPITLSCISNPIAGSAISTAYWSGLRLRDLLEDLGLAAEVNYLFLESADGFYETVTMADMMDPKTLLVYGMNENTLPNRHGYPLRIYIPNRYGMKQPKWITRMTATAEDQGGYWTERGWSKEAHPNIASVIDTIAPEEMHDDLIPVGGVAWAGDRGIQRVEVQIDDGPWTEAALRTPPLGPLTWVQWRYEWPAEPGDHSITVRAVDGEGMVQVAEETPTRPDGPTGYHTRDVSV